MSTTGIRSLLIPLGEKYFLVPSACIAEVTAYREPERIADMQPSWLLGIINWRNQRVPVLAIESILAIPAFAKDAKRRLVIFYGLGLNGLELNQVVPFYGLVATDIPRALTVAPEHLGLPHEDNPPATAFSVDMPGDDNIVVWLPDIGYFENLLRKSSGFLGLKG